MFKPNDVDAHKLQEIAKIYEDYGQFAKEHFLPWYRAYLRYVETKLQEFSPDIAIPYWEWWESPSIPKAFSQERIDSTLNVLWDATRTSQEILPGAVTLLSETMELPADFSGMSRELDYAHSLVHVTIGGNMAVVNHAGYDPLNLVIMAAVDHRWYEWEQVHPEAAPDDLNKILEPFSLTVRETLSTMQPPGVHPP
jgi:hypothetical protein